MGHRFSKQQKALESLKKLKEEHRRKSCTHFAITAPMDALKNRIIFCFWTGSNPMTEARKESLNNMREITHCTIILVTPETLPCWEVKSDPIHPAQPFLSAVHKSDYLRAQFMHHQGGGYSDVKTPTGDWRSCFTEVEENPSVWITGYAEEDPLDIAKIPNKELRKKIQEVQSSIVGNGGQICRKGTALTREWLTEVHRALDGAQAELKEYPAPHPRASKQEDPEQALEWTEICGNIFHPLVQKYLSQVRTSLPPPICKNQQ